MRSPKTHESGKGSANPSNAAPVLVVTSASTDMLGEASTSSTPPPPVSAATTATATSSRSTSGTMTSPRAHATAQCAHEARRTSASTATSRRSSSDEACEACVLDRPYVERIRSISHVFLAIRLMFTDPQRRRALFTNWIHVPLGITSLLFLTWLIKQAMDRAPFRFPSPVLAMLLLFIMLLSLDYVSTTKPVREFAARRGMGKDGKLLLQPLLVVLEAPCDFCLRYMSVMFTPSFILIPAREVINGREIGLITGWFAASQLLALIFPVLLHKAIRWTVGAVRQRRRSRKDKREAKTRRADETRRASVATLVAVMSNINAVQPSTSAKDSEKGAHIVGGEKLGSIATGLSGMTAIATAPLTLNTRESATAAGSLHGQLRIERQDAQRQLEHVQLETARQQGDPYATSHTRLPEHHHHYPLFPSAPNSPRPASVLHHNHRLHQQQNSAGYFAARGRGGVQEDRPVLGRSRSLARSWVGRAAVSPSRASVRPQSGGGTRGKVATKGMFGAAVVGPGSGLKNLALQARRPQSASAASESQAGGRFEDRNGAVEDDGVSPTFDEYIFRARQDLLDRRRSKAESVDPRSDEGLETLVMPTLVPTTPTRSSHDEAHDSKLTKAIMIDDDIEAGPASPELAGSAEKPSSTSKGVDADLPAQITTTDVGSPKEEEEEEPEMDAVDRLVETLWNSIPWLVLGLTLVVGIPVFFLLDISLPLFLGVNLVTFLASITLVPARIRRYAHPILTTSVATVLLLWALGAMRGWSLKRTLASYSVDAKYTVLWSLQGYTGPVIGAGDVLFSTLDAGIVSLAIPMYRYRWDLWVHLVDMLVVLLPCSMLSLFVWPTVASSIGIAPERALAFASRFMSTPLAIELSLTIGADESLTVVLVVITGILISIFKDPFFRLFGLNPDQDGPPSSSSSSSGSNADKHQTNTRGQDYLTIGIAMGSTAGAIGASSLISKPRSMAIASLSFVLFGAILLIFAAIPPIVDTLRTLASAPLQFTPAS
ncbi:hypothetical protein EX895_002545 [Sporisorium graminicola]|uniref:LrgB-like protein n=1 Tax=Sporisorium graminicola TaxID=280036 RepID=A0A4U7KWF7_9BASI|nr:hypothetical protein EX895_002545 [Sporisorium graminicola]TKY88556.1 hypothetical protein EX895_002545 [Sporisorium graminicola]